MDIPNTVLHLINSIRTQGNLLTSLSGAGVVLVLLTWLRVCGVVSDVDLRRFRWSNFLVLPLVLFVLAFASGHVLNAALTGYFTEIATNWITNGNGAITNAKQHFMDHYFDCLKYLSMIQICCNVFAVIALSVWVIGNLRVGVRRRTQP